MDDQQAREDLKALVESQPLAVLATEGEGLPYTSLVAFAATDDLKSLLFATTRATRKFRNLEGNPRVSLLVDNRSNREEDFHAAMAATAIGTAREGDEGESAEMRERYISRHPHLSDFVGARTCALLHVKVERYYLVRRFQEVLEIIP